MTISRKGLPRLVDNEFPCSRRSGTGQARLDLLLVCALGFGLLSISASLASQGVSVVKKVSGKTESESLLLGLAKQCALSAVTGSELAGLDAGFRFNHSVRFSGGVLFDDAFNTSRAIDFACGKW